MRNEKPDIKDGQPPHSPLVVMSRRAPSWLLEVAPWRCSPVTGCKCGSMHTLLQTSVRRLAAISLISLCHKVGKPPLEQERAISTKNCEPQSQLTGV